MAAHPPETDPVDPFDPPLSWLRARRGTKWAEAARARTAPGSRYADVLPAWVADMDFPVAPCVRDALVALLDRGDLAYPDWSGAPDDHPLARAWADRMTARYAWSPDPRHVRHADDLIQALHVVLALASRAGDGVVAHTPGYPPFLTAAGDDGRTPLLLPLERVGEGAATTWAWDDDALDRLAARARVLLLVDPHNPTGRAFTRAELERVAAVAERHDLLVVADGIHAELVHAPHRHTPFASLSADAAARTVTVTSATKAFNLAGVRTALVHVGPAWLRERWDARPPELWGVPNVPGVEATLAAWRDGDAWQEQLAGVLRAHRDLAVARVATWPGVRTHSPDAGYLLWLDGTDLARAVGLGGPDDPGGPDLADWFLDHAGVMLAGGRRYGGPATRHHVRLNVATGPRVLGEVLDRLESVLPH